MLKLSDMEVMRRIVTRVSGLFVQIRNNEWMAKHCRDPWVIKAAQEKMRARSGFKIIELQKRLGLIRRGHNILELGAAPGGWTQQIVKWKSAGNTLIAVDKLSFSPVEGAVCLGACDFSSPRGVRKIFDQLDRIGKLHGVVSDACPNLSGQHELDNFRIADMISGIWHNYLEGNTHNIDGCEHKRGSIEYFLFKCFHVTTYLASLKQFA